MKEAAIGCGVAGAVDIGGVWFGGVVHRKELPFGFRRRENASRSIPTDFMGAAGRLPRWSRARLRGPAEVATCDGEAGRGPSAGFPCCPGDYPSGGGGNEGLRGHFGCGYECGEGIPGVAAGMPRVLRSCDGEVRAVQGCQILVGNAKISPFFSS